MKKLNQRNFLGGIMAAGSVMFLLGGCCGICETKCAKACETKCDKPKVVRPISPSLRQSKMPFKLGVARWTLHLEPFDSSLRILRDLDVHNVGMLYKTISYDATDAEIAAHKAKCAEYGVQIVSEGPADFTSEEKIKTVFEFAKRYGIKFIACVPSELDPRIAGIADEKERLKVLPNKKEWNIESDRMLDIMDKYVKLYDIKVGIHNHGPDMPRCFPNGAAGLARIGNRDRRIGLCYDIGHAKRSGEDPVKFIREHSDRIYEVHLKNIEVDPAKNRAKEGPRGELDIPGVIKALSDVNYTGFCLVEYETNYDCIESPLAESVGYYRGIMDAVEALGK